MGRRGDSVTGRRYESFEQPQYGDQVIVMKGTGPGGRVIPFPVDDFVVVQLWTEGAPDPNAVPILVEIKALLKL